MKNKKIFFDCLKALIKKKFFNGPETDICQDYKISISIPGITSEDILQKEAEEYLKNYNSVTRWQTV
jgi:hypothetical protein